MKKILYIIISFCLLFSVGFAAGDEDGKKGGDSSQQYESSRKFEQSPVSILNSVKGKANKDRSEQVQNTKLDGISSSVCLDMSVDSRFTITKTLCNIKIHIRSYLEYIIYIGLTVATIFIIRNGFLLVTSSERGKKMTEFVTNLKNIIIGVVLIIGFYYIIDIFVSVVNLIFE